MATRTPEPLISWTLARATCALALILALNGCTIARWYSGVPPRAESTVLVQGQSTKSEVLQIFGAPTQIAHQTDGDTFIYTYDRWNYSSFTIAEPFTGQRIFSYTRGFNNRDRLVVLFDYGGVVRAVAVEHETKAMPRL